MKMGALYGVYENGVEVFRGSRQEVVDLLNVNTSNIDYAVLHQSLVNDKYTLDIIDRNCEWEYRVYRSEGEIRTICTGDKKDIMKYLKVSARELNKAIKFNTYIKGYRIQKKLVEYGNVQNMPIPAVDEDIEYLKTHLKMYGNTIKRCVKQKIDYYLTELKNQGYVCTAEKSKDDFKSYIITLKERRI